MSHTLKVTRTNIFRARLEILGPYSDSGDEIDGAQVGPINFTLSKASKAKIDLEDGRLYLMVVEILAPAGAKLKVEIACNDGSKTTSKEITVPRTAKKGSGNNRVFLTSYGFRAPTCADGEGE